MTDSFHDFQVDSPSEPLSAAGRYDKLQQAGMATRFVKGTSGNPSGRPKRIRSERRVEELADLLRGMLDRA
jgi:hypothetical protein